MGSLGWWEILLIALVIVLFFGARKLPEIGRGLGDGIRSFRNAMKGDQSGQDQDDSGGASGDGK